MPESWFDLDERAGMIPSAEQVYGQNAIFACHTGLSLGAYRRNLLI